MTDPIKVPSAGEQELPPEAVTDSSIELILSGLLKPNQGMSKALAREVKRLREADGTAERVRELEEALGKLAAGFHDEITALKHQNQILQECQANHSWWIKRAGELEEALKDVLSRLPDMDIIEALKADEGLGYRLMPMKPTPSDADVVKWMAALKGREQ